MKINKNKFQLDFLGIGVEKSGTSWIAECLMEHPEVNLPKEKELFFFNAYDPHYLKVENLKYDTLGFDWYERQFKKSGRKKINGEFTPTYIYCEKAAKRIKENSPDIKFIVVLRNPSQRAFSQYIHDKKIGLIKNISFEEALKRHENYIEKGLYSKYLKMYFSHFPRENFFITTFDDILAKPQKLMEEIYSFLELEKTDYIAKNTFKKSNQASKTIIPSLNFFMIHTEYFLRRKKLLFILNSFEKLKIRKLALSIRNINTKPIKKYPEINEKTDLKLKKNFKKEINALEELLGKNLDNWK